MWYPFGPLAWFLAPPDGSPVVTAKGTLLPFMEGNPEPLNHVPVAALWILDEKAML